MKNPYFSFTNILPTDNILIFSFASFHAIETVSDQIIFTLLPWTFIDIRLSPGVNRNFFRKIGTVPFFNSRRFFPKDLQSLLRGGVPPYVESECIESCTKKLNLCLR